MNDEDREPPTSPTPPDRQAESVEAEEPPRLPFPVVGLGASAGGLEALSAFLDAMPPDAGMAFVVVQHLPPDREAMLVELLAKHTPMPVTEITDGMAVAPNRVYVIRPSHTLTLRNGALRLGEPLEAPRHGRPVDDFFRSLAEEQRHRAIGIVFSGMGSNGTAGAQNIKAVGGLCIAQDPDSARFPSMPQHVIAQGDADLVLRPEAMPEALLRFTSHAYSSTTSDTASAGALVERDRPFVDEILAILRARTRHDFRGYKRPTVVRRIHRRMGVHHVGQVSAYAQTLRRNPTEATALSDDLLIHVTGFFRDAEAWETVKHQVLAPLVAERRADEPIRCWVTACSSGEEAYTLAILLAEAADEAGKRFDVKIFATDMAQRSLAQARAGIYPNGIETEITPERLERFFTREDGVYRVKPELRETVVFAPQNVLHDPPFSRIDLCTCRNLLIYLEPSMQARILSLLHFALREGGALFLGPSETAAGAEDLFEATDKRWRIFRRVGPTRHRAVDFPLDRVTTLERGDRESPSTGNRGAGASVAQLTARALLERFSPAAVVLDRACRVVFFHGETERYLLQPRGEPTRDVLQLAREGLRAAVRTVLAELAAKKTIAVGHGPLARASGEVRSVRVTASLLDVKTAAGYVLITFEDRPEAPPLLAEVAAGEDSPQLRSELGRIREELQRSIADLQISNEELFASNEEITSINEELQSTNEELETSKEELQSLNEELTTVNAQLQAKIQDHEATSNDLSSLLSSTDIAVVFLDTSFRIRRYTPAVKDLFDLIPSDVGRPLTDLARKFVDPDLLGDAEKVLDRLAPIELEVSSESGRSYLRRVLPYRTIDLRIAGVVLTFVDITARKRSDAALLDREEQFRLLVEGARDFAMVLFDVRGRIASWNAGAERLFGYTQAEAVGQDGALVFTPEAAAAGVAARELEKAARDGRAEDARWLVRKDGGRFFGTGVLTALRDARGALRGYVKVMRDDTMRNFAEETLRDAAQQAEAANRMKDEFLATLSHELRTPLAAILIWIKILEQDGADPAVRAKAIDAVAQSTHAQSELVEHLLDSSRIGAGTLRIVMRDAELAPLVTAWVDAIRPGADEKGVRLELDVAERIGVVSTAPDRLQQVVWNLVTNAVKFTPSGGRIVVSLRRDAERIELRVADTGRGISPEFLPHVFQPFRQDDSSSTRAAGGLGLGLAISKNLVNLLGGSLSVESGGAGKGTTLIVHLPARRELEGTMAAAGPRALGAGGELDAVFEGAHVLVVEDTQVTRDAIAHVLGGAGARVTAVDSAGAGFEAYRQGAPDVLLTDIAMPGEDGYSLIRRIRTFEETQGTPRVPAIAATALARDIDRTRALDAGFDAYAAKPLSAERLLALVRQALLGRARGARLGA